MMLTRHVQWRPALRPLGSSKSAPRGRQHVAARATTCRSAQACSGVAPSPRPVDLRAFLQHQPRCVDVALQQVEQRRPCRSSCARSTSAPLSSNSRAASTWPFWQAMNSGVRPFSFARSRRPRLYPAAAALLRRGRSGRRRCSGRATAIDPPSPGRIRAFLQYSGAAPLLDRVAALAGDV